MTAFELASTIAIVTGTGGFGYCHDPGSPTTW